ncbi:MAG: ATP-binding protein [Clostridia bacterium]|nr:ATP-binding protein [Clostridia bacterium]
MIIAIILVFLMLLLGLFINFKKRVVWVFILYFISLCGLFYTSMLYIATFSTYPFFTNIDYYLYQAVSAHPIHMSVLVSLHNLGTAMLMLSNMFMTMLILPKKNRCVFILFLLPVAIFLAINDPEVRYWAFLHSNMEGSLFSSSAFIFSEFSGCVSLAFFLIYMIIPIFSLIFYQRRLKVQRSLETTIYTTFSLIVIDVFIFVYFIFGSFAPFMPWNADMLSFPKGVFVFSYQALLLPSMLFVCVFIFCIITIFKPFGIASVFVRKKMFRMQTDIAYSLRMVFHSEKNTLLAVERLAVQAEEFYEKNPAVSRENISDIALLARDSMNSLSHTLDMLTAISVVKQTNTLLLDCVQNAIRLANIPPKIKLTLVCPDENICINALASHVSEALANVLRNSVEAIEQKSLEIGAIAIEVFAENTFACVQVTDNGCGINRKNISHIFSVLFSTKRSAKNWGVGLSYVKNVAEMYGGNVYVKSKVGEYTVFQFVLPLAERKAKL